MIDAKLARETKGTTVLQLCLYRTALARFRDYCRSLLMW